MAVFVVLLRAIGPVTHKLMSMAQWRAAAEADGFGNPQTYVATGNMIVAADATAAQVTARMDAIVSKLGLGPGNKAVVRTATQLQALVRAAPFPEAIGQRPSEIGVYFFVGERPDFGWITGYVGLERIHIEGEHLIVDYAGRGSASRLPGIIEKKSGVVTARNWNTLRGLAERAGAR
ncbi:DUF1697 domain-containing protein [Devosia sp. 2618]|uniref:DUF1697 domain-containing protein n=1 Tax=Devosia sp. 2618 TaxID=3156454 RepID=UPI0033926088